MTVGIVRVIAVGPSAWWAVVGFCHCGCGRVARAALGATVENAAWNWRHQRRAVAVASEATR